MLTPAAGARRLPRAWDETAPPRAAGSRVPQARRAPARRAARPTAHEEPGTVKLRVAYMMNPRLAPLLDGTVKAEGIDLEFELGLSSHWFYHHLTQNDF